MPVQFVPGWQPKPSFGADLTGGIAEGLQSALEAYRTLKKDKQDYDLRMKEMQMRSQESEIRRQAATFAFEEAKKKADEEEASLRLALAEPGGEDEIGALPVQVRSGGPLASLIQPPTTQVTPTQVPDLGAAFEGRPQPPPSAPAAAVPPTPTVSPNPPLSSVVKQVNMALMGTLPKGPLTPEMRAKGRQNLIQTLQDREIEKQRQMDLLRDTTIAPSDIDLGEFGRFKKGDRVPNAFIQAANQRATQEAIAARQQAHDAGVFANALAVAGIRAGTAGGANAPGNQMQGQELLDSLDPKTRNTVIGIVEGRINPTTFSVRNGERARWIQLANQADPTYNMQDYQARVRARQDFVSGKAAANVRSLNTVMGHLEDFSKAAKALDNRSVQLWNKFANYGLTQVGDPRVTNFEKTANAVESELASLFKGMGATDQEIKAWRETLNASQSPAQLQEGVKTLIRLVESRMDALQQQYRQGMGRQPSPDELLTPKARSIYERLTGSKLESVGPPATSGLKAPSAADDDPLGLWK